MRLDDLPGGAPAGGWGRVGPDLGLEGHRRSDDWHLAHLYAPDAVVPGSRMPAYRHLFRATAGRPDPTGEGRALVAYLQALGRGDRDVWSEWRRVEPVIPDPPAATAGQRDLGERLYRRHCVACHGPEGDGHGPAAALLARPPRDLREGRAMFKSTPGHAPPSDSDLYRALTLGSGAGSAMPGFHHLGADERWALVLRVKEFSAARGERPPGPGGRAIPKEGMPPGGDAIHGRAVWDQLGCASCHGETGQGGGNAGDLRHACRYRGGASRTALERAILLGVGPEMPAYGESLPRAGALDDLIAFLRSLDREDAPEDGAVTSPRTPGRR